MKKRKFTFVFNSKTHANTDIVAQLWQVRMDCRKRKKS